MALPPFQTVIDDHGPVVHRFLIARVGRGEADDVYQDTFLAALRAYPSLDDRAHVRAWLMTIAQHKAIDHFRTRSRAPLPLEHPPEPAARSDEWPPPGDDPVWGRVARLPDKQRTAVALRFLADLSHAEIGMAMDTSEAAARRNVHEGVRRLREELSR